MQCIVVDVSGRDRWIDQPDPHHTRAVGLHVPVKSRPTLIHPTLEDAERDASRLACETGSGFGGTFAVFELVAVVRATVLADTDSVRGIGACGAMCPTWQTEKLTV